MDIELQRKVNEAMTELNRLSVENFDYQHLDPVAKMMLVALLHETQKIENEFERLQDNITEHFCEHFIPRREVLAMPAVAVVAPKRGVANVHAVAEVNNGAAFTVKVDGSKNPLNFMPLFRNTVIPCEDVIIVTPHYLHTNTGRQEIYGMAANTMWIGLNTRAESDTLRGFSFMLRGMYGIVPEHISIVGSEQRALNFATMDRMEDIDMLEPFDSQQSSPTFFSLLQHWKERLLDMSDGDIIYITERYNDRDLFKPRTYPRQLQEAIEQHTLDTLSDHVVWLKLQFDKDVVVSDDCEVLVNTMPVVNINVNTLTLSNAAPIAKLQNGENSFFLQLLETSNNAHREGFNMQADEIIVRDFDAVCYHDGLLHNEVHNLYNHFIEDYYAFIDYHNIRDGEEIKRLRNIINRIGRSVGLQNDGFKYDSGTYVMKNINQQQQSVSTNVAYLTTQGAQGNMPTAGHTMDNRRVPVLGAEVEVVVSAMGGCDKATSDQHYELLHYYALTNDRLYTRMDVEAFLRKELISMYGREEFKRITIHSSIEGAMGERGLQRGLYVDIEFKDHKNYERAQRLQLQHVMQCRIKNRACICMPVVVKLKDLDDRY